MIGTSFDRIYATLQEGAIKYGPDTWRKETLDHHYNRASQHLRNWAVGSNVEDDLAHALIRIYFLMELEHSASLTEGT